jgi:hypothetical protein
MDSQPVRFIEGAGSMHEPEGRGRLAALLARELGTDCGLIAPEMPDADNPHYQPWRDRMSRSLVRRLRPAELPRGGLIPEACPGLVPSLGSQLGPRRLDVRRIRGTERRWLEAARIEDLPVPRSR